MEIKRFIIPFDCKMDDANNGMGLFEGYGSIFGNIDLGGDIIEGGAFSKSLAEWSAKGQLPQMLGFHKNDNVIGDWLEMREDENGLYVKGQLWVKGESRIEQAVVSHNIMKGTGPKGLSIGYRVKEQELVEFQGGTVRRLKEIELFEVSVVGYAMKRVVERVLRESGLSKSQSQAFIADGYKALERDAKSSETVEDRDDSSDLSGLLESLEKLSSNY